MIASFMGGELSGISSSKHNRRRFANRWVGPNFWPTPFAQAPLASRSGRRHRAFCFYRPSCLVPGVVFRASPPGFGPKTPPPLTTDPVSARRSGVGLRFIAFSKASSLAFLRLVACVPGERGVGLDGCASSLPCRVRRVGHPATGLVHSGDIHGRRLLSALSRLRHRPKIATTSCPSASLSLVHNQKCGWSGHSSRRASRGHPATTKKATFAVAS